MGHLSTHPPKTADANNHHDTLSPLPDLVSLRHSAPHPAPGADEGPSRHVRAQAGGEGEGKGREPRWPGHPAFNPAHPAGSSGVPQDRRELGYLYTNPGQVCTWGPRSTWKRKPFKGRELEGGPAG